MIKSLKIRIIITVAICLAALYFLVPTFVTQIPSPWNDYFPKDKIHLGLDLQGGMHLVLEVDAEKALESMVERMSADLKESLMEGKVRFRKVERAKGATISLDLTEAAGKTALDKILNEQFFDLEIASSTPRDGGMLVDLKIKDKRAIELKKLTIEHSLETIRNRVDAREYPRRRHYCIWFAHRQINRSKRLSALFVEKQGAFDRSFAGNG